MSKLIAGWMVFYIIFFHLMIILIPIVVDEYKEKYSKPLDTPHLCPYPLFKHGVGSDLKTFRIIKDLCTDY